jgi:hypothetical protein
MGTSAAYRNLSESESENSTPASTLNSKGPQLLQEVQQQRTPKSKFTTLKVCRDLEALCEMGLLEAYRLPFDNLVRYRPVKGKIV